MGEEEISFEAVTTRGGDHGKTSTFSGERVFKNSPEMEVIGELDELNCFVGLLYKAEIEEYRLLYHERFKETTPIPDMLNVVQCSMEKAMATIATDPKSTLYRTLNFITDSDIELVEGWERILLERVEVPQRFVKPRTYADVCRVICRRAERRLITYIRNQSESGGRVIFHDLYAIQRYLNRLGDFFYLLGREEDELYKREILK